MPMWLRLAGAVLITAAVLAVIDFLGLQPGWPPRTFEDVQHDAQVRLREAFWLAICVFVMVMSLVAAARRRAARLKRALAIARSHRRDVA